VCRLRSTKRIPWTLVLLVVSSLFVSCRESAPLPAPIPHNPSRIVSLAPSLTEIVYDLGLGEKVVGVSDFATYPPEVKKVQRLGGLMNPNLELLTTLEPDLILTHTSSAKITEHAAKLRIPTLALSTDTVDDIMQCYKEIGRVTGRVEPAARRVAELRVGLAAAPPVDSKPLRVLMVVGRNPGTLEGLTSAGPGTFLHELLTDAGAVNVVANIDRPWPQVSKEYLMVNSPDVVIELRPNSAIKPTELVRVWSALPELSAVKTGRVYQLNGDYLLLPGPRVIETAADLRTVLAKAAAAQ